jgi:hypothetical protein
MKPRFTGSFQKSNELAADVALPSEVQMEVAVPILEHRSVRGGEPFDQ